MKRLSILMTAVTMTAIHAAAQRVITGDALPCPDGSGPVRSTILHSDSACTSFLLCIDAAVRPHLHRTHTEHVFILEGDALMTLGDSERTLHAGDVVLIPQGTPHAVKVTGNRPLKLISVQAPFFDGTDRVWLDE
jgi:mannose-6-phosphate isomerase-like protein (cupin superfamily)